MPYTLTNTPILTQGINAAPGFHLPGATVTGDENGGRLEVNVVGDYSRFDKLAVASACCLNVSGEKILDGQTQVAYANVARWPFGSQYTYKAASGWQLRAWMTGIAFETRPAIVLFHGGGWINGNPSLLNEYARYFASRGMVTILPEYRLADPTDAPLVCVQDARSAMRWVRSHAQEFGIDPTKIAALGVSAGGQLAAHCGMIDALNDPTDNVAVSCKPDALVLLSPVVDCGPPNGFGYSRIGAEYPNYSPLHNASLNAPPSLLLMGAADETVSPARAAEFNDAIGGQSYFYTNATHTLPDYQWNKPEHYDILARIDAFLAGLGWLTAGPAPTMPTSAPTNDLRYPRLLVHFNSLATPAVIQRVIRQVSYQVQTGGTVGDRELRYTLKAPGGATVQVSQGVSVQ